MDNKNKEDSSHLWNNHSLRNTIMLMVVIQTIVVILSLFTNPWIGIILLLLTIVVVYALHELDKKQSSEMEEYIKHLSYRIKRGEQESLIKMPIGIILYEDDEIEWLNPYMITQLSSEDVLGKKLSEITPELATEMRDNHKKTEFEINWNDKTFHVLRERENQVLYLLDITKYVKIEEQFEKSRPVIGFILLDNYNELIRDLDDREISRLDTMLTTYFSNWFRQRNIYYRKLANDRYLLLLNKKELDRLEDEKFSIIDSIRERTSKRNVPLTISIGLAYGEDDFDEIAEVAQNNIDLALARGGDQAIVSEHGEDPRYYGGKSDPMVKRTRVRSRMVTQALENLLQQSEEIFIMGHKAPDLDALGAALGIHRIAQINHKKSWVVIDLEDLNSDAKQLVNLALKNEDIKNDIISPEGAIEKADAESLIILVDHHRPSLSIEPGLVEVSNRIVIIDHHRRGNEFPEDPLLVYIEPYASSTAELVTEMFEYVTGDGKPINKLEATALLGGIVVDSNNFSLRTGSRTFNAASFLQSVGANNVLIREILAEDYDVYLKRSHLIERLESYSDSVVISVGEEDKEYNSVLAAQAADTLLSFSNVDASFVITKRPDGKIGISARSVGDINVQLIMERMGGGGHLSNAATQVEDATVAQVKESLIETLDAYFED